MVGRFVVGNFVVGRFVVGFFVVKAVESVGSLVKAIVVMGEFNTTIAMSFFCVLKYAFGW